MKCSSWLANKKQKNKKKQKKTKEWKTISAIYTAQEQDGKSKGAAAWLYIHAGEKDAEIKWNKNDRRRRRRVYIVVVLFSPFLHGLWAMAAAAFLYRRHQAVHCAAATLKASRTIASSREYCVERGGGMVVTWPRSTISWAVSLPLWMWLSILVTV